MIVNFSRKLQKNTFTLLLKKCNLISSYFVRCTPDYVPLATNETDLVNQDFDLDTQYQYPKKHKYWKVAANKGHWPHTFLQCIDNIQLIWDTILYLWLFCEYIWLTFYSNVSRPIDIPPDILCYLSASPFWKDPSSWQWFIYGISLNL